MLNSKKILVALSFAFVTTAVSAQNAAIVNGNLLDAADDT